MRVGYREGELKRPFVVVPQMPWNVTIPHTSDTFNLEPYTENFSQTKGGMIDLSMIPTSDTFNIEPYTENFSQTKNFSKQV